MRLRILARDVSIARSHHDDVSIMNLLPATIATHAAEDHPALALLQLHVGNTPLLARLTRHSARRLELVPGQQVWVQIQACRRGFRYHGTYRGLPKATEPPRSAP